MNKKIIILLLTCCVMIFSGCSLQKETIGSNSNTVSTFEEEVLASEREEKASIMLEEPTPEPIVEPDPIYEKISLAAVGDNLIHNTVIKAGKTEEAYDYTSMYSNIKDYISQFDIKVINQETVLINDPAQYSGYPTFGSPIQIGDAVIDAGFNLVTQATNHAYDKKQQGILDSIAYWDEHNIPVLGIHDEENENVYIWQTETMKIAMLNYTYGLNGFILPEGKEYLVDSLYDEQKVLSDLQYAEENADITIVFPHWGTEYTLTETSEQIRLAQMLADNGADIIIGCHPHVIEPLKAITSADGKVVPCFYSLGNFVSAQSEVPRMLGAIAEVEIVNDDGNIYIENAKMTPIVTHIKQGYSGFEVYLFKEYTEELASSHKLQSKGLSIDKLNEIFNGVISNNTYPIIKEME